MAKKAEGLTERLRSTQGRRGAGPAAPGPAARGRGAGVPRAQHPAGRADRHRDRAAAAGGRARRGEAGRAAREVPPERLSVAPWPRRSSSTSGCPRPGRRTSSRCSGVPKAALATDGYLLPGSGPPRAPVGRPRAPGAPEPRAPPPEGARHAGPARQGGAPAPGAGHPHPRVHVRRRPRAGRPADRVARARPRCTSSSPRATPSGMLTAGWAEYVKNGGTKPLAEMRGDRHRRPGRVRLADVGPRRACCAAGAGTSRPSRCTCSRCPARTRRATSTGATSPGCSASTPTGTTRRRSRATRRSASSRSSCCGGSTRTSRRSASPSTAAPGSAATSPRATWSARRGSGSAPTTARWPSAASARTGRWRIIERRGYHVVGDVGEPPGAR